MMVWALFASARVQYRRPLSLQRTRSWRPQPFRLGTGSPRMANAVNAAVLQHIPLPFPIGAEELASISALPSVPRRRWIREPIRPFTFCPELLTTERARRGRSSVHRPSASG
jgi:hypothetical protein